MATFKLLNCNLKPGSFYFCIAKCLKKHRGLDLLQGGFILTVEQADGGRALKGATKKSGTKALAKKAGVAKKTAKKKR
jgi:hypothetical protein